MIQIIDKTNCCGCSACEQVCPKHCISMTQDAEGFLYPVVNTEWCIDCGLCEKVCPMYRKVVTREPMAVYAAKNNDENIRLASSSGGIFTLLAEAVLERGGVVYGARFDDVWNVIHDYTETKEGLSLFRGSKYVQSKIGDCYRTCLSFLKQGRLVLFSGTSCQIAGLKSFLRKEFTNLLTVDVVCHGVPSPAVWKLYLKHFAQDSKSISHISFRNKETGWKAYSNVLSVLNKNIVHESYTENKFMKLFLSNTILRPSCYGCKFKAGKSGSDVTLADFWGIDKIDPAFDDDKGVSAVLIYNDKASGWLTLSDTKAFTYQDVLKGNYSLAYSVAQPVNRTYFFRMMSKGYDFDNLYIKCFDTSIYRRMRRLIFRKFGI